MREKIKQSVQQNGRLPLKNKKHPLSATKNSTAKTPLKRRDRHILSYMAGVPFT
ncbi:hypothetical protein EBME_1825 [bacterium endosymbiont of Mortierella elongata FMR23-6]|nr:hypothetical protein EBME_1825 [bacterium endosymbiont of Mortierella elongata FMR23-6]